MRYLFGTIFLLVPLQVLGAGVIINEIAWMGMPPDLANDEWIELYNNSSLAVSFEGWKLVAQDGTPDITLSGTIGPNGFFLLERTDDNTVPNVTADQIYAGALSNSGEILILKDGNNNEVDRVDGSSNWAIGGNNTTKETLQRSGSGWITATSTPRAANQGESAESSPSPLSSASSSSTSGSGSVSVPPPTIPTIKAFAGEDKTVIAGANVEFMAHALGLDEKPLDSARFWWNFGDGGTKEGRVVSHIFQIPGKYSVGLHVSSGSYAASDYLTVSVVPNPIAVKEVLLGEKGFILLLNPTDTDLDIGGWTIEDAQKKKFIIPVKTKIGARSEMALANSVSGVLRGGAANSFVIDYPDGTAVLNWKQKEEIKADKNIFQVEISKTETSGSPKQETSLVESAPSPDQQIEKRQQKGEAYISGAAVPTQNLFFLFAFVLSSIAAVGFLVIKRLYF